jgi:hypothetical protein
VTWLEFFASVVSSLAWPIAIFGAVWVFRREIRPLLPRLYLKHKDTEISFRRGLEDAEKVVEQLPPPSPDSPPATPEETTRFERIAEISPRAALMELRMEVEEVLRREWERHAQSNRPWRTARSAREMLRQLRASGQIGSRAAALFEDILAMGNIAAHDHEAKFTKEDAMRYRDVVDRAIDLLDFNAVEMEDVSEQ